MADPVPQPPDMSNLPVSSNLASAISDSGQNLAALATPSAAPGPETGGSLQSAIASPDTLPAPDISTVTAGSQPDTSSLQGVLNASQPAQAHFQPTIGSRLKGVLLGLATGGIGGAVLGGISPTTEQQIFSNRQQLAAAKVKFANAQSALMVAQASRQQAELANYDADHQRAVFKDNLATATELMQMGCPPSYTTADDTQSEMAAMQHATATQGAVPPSVSLAVAPGAIMHFDLSAANGQHAQYQFYAQLQKDLGKPVPSEQMFMSQNPQQRYAMVADAMHYFNPPATPQSLAILQSDRETLAHLPENVAPSNRDTTLAHLDSTINNIQSAITKNKIAERQAEGAGQAAATAAETPAKVAQTVAIENAKANTPSGQLEQAEKRVSLQEKALSVKKTMEEPVIGFNPQTGERELVSRDDARAGGFTQTVPVKEGDVEKYRTATSQFNDVQINVSRYRDAFANFAQHGAASDLPKLNVVINDAKLGGGIKLGSMGELQLPLGSSLAEAADRVARSTAYKDLSPAGKGLVDGYLRTMGAVPAYQKALTGIGRSNKEMLDLELKNIPDPTYAPADADRKLQSFQENIDQGSAGIPRIQGVPTPKDVRRQFEGGVRQTFRVPTFAQ